MTAPRDATRTTATEGAPGGAPLLAIVVAVLGAILAIIGLILDPRRAAAAYLAAYMASLAAVLGALAMIMIARVTAATWFVALRRQAEQVVATLPVLAVLFIPVLLAAHLLYPWTWPDAALAADVRTAVHAKSSYLDMPFFVVRAAVYWATWLVLGEVLRRASLAQDRGDTPDIEHRMRTASAVGLVAFALTVTFASFDWMMSLSPAWYSTIYGVQYFGGAMVSALALLAVLVARGRWRGELPRAVGADHMHALAKLLLTFVLFWVYIGFSQLIVIWSAEIPAEVTWYVSRMRGGWRALGAVLVFGHFALPFCALLVRSIKRSTVSMALLGAWLLVMHYLDVYWLIMPSAVHTSQNAYWMDLGAVMLIAGLCCATWSIRRRAEPGVAVGDPAVSASLEYTTA
jgi:hypothetical protein